MREEELLSKMRADWDARARQNAGHYIANYRDDWDEEEFYQSGVETVSQLIFTDMLNICGEAKKLPRDMSVLEIGCGAGRVTRAFAKVFGEVHAVDVSGEMVERAKRAVAGLPHAFIYQNNGRDLDVLGDRMFDFAFSTCVFHHVPSKSVIESYIRAVGQRLRPGCLFKFEVQGCLAMKPASDDTWLGAPMREADMQGIAARCGFEIRYEDGAGQERYWLWFFKT